MRIALHGPSIFVYIYQESETYLLIWRGSYKLRLYNRGCLYVNTTISHPSRKCQQVRDLIHALDMRAYDMADIYI